MSEPIDLNEYFPYFLGTVSNKWSAASSRDYLKEFGIGTSEWRVLASLATLGAASSNEIVQLIAMDAGAVSRCVRKLEGQALVAPVEGRFAGRTKPYELTAKGRDLSAQISKRALDREDRLLANLTSEERAELLRIMRKVMRNMNQI